jgi:hypothetical protein
MRALFTLFSDSFLLLKDFRAEAVRENPFELFLEVHSPIAGYYSTHRRQGKGEERRTRRLLFPS